MRRSVSNGQERSCVTMCINSHQARTRAVRCRAEARKQNGSRRRAIIEGAGLRKPRFRVAEAPDGGGPGASANASLRAVAHVAEGRDRRSLFGI